MELFPDVATPKTCAPTCNAYWLDICSIEWRAIACAISCPITVAKPSSFAVNGKIPVYTATFPPGIHQAFTSALCTKLNSQLKLNWFDRPSAFKYWFTAAAILFPTCFTNVASDVPVTTFVLGLPKNSLYATAACCCIWSSLTSDNCFLPDNGTVEHAVMIAAIVIKKVYL